jgi:hypothetical protein
MCEKLIGNNAFQNFKLISFNLWNPHKNSLKIIDMSCFPIIIVRENRIKKQVFDSSIFNVLNFY